MKNSVLIAPLFREKKTGALFQLACFRSVLNQDGDFAVTEIGLYSVETKMIFRNPSVKSFDEDFEAI